MGIVLECVDINIIQAEHTPCSRITPTPLRIRGPQQEPLESTTAAKVSSEEKSGRNSAHVEKEASQ